jgi:hypothetical protein
MAEEVGEDHFVHEAAELGVVSRDEGDDGLQRKETISLENEGRQKASTPSAVPCRQRGIPSLPTASR